MCLCHGDANYVNQLVLFLLRTNTKLQNFLSFMCANDIEYITNTLV